MKDRYRIFRRGCGIYYLRDRVTLRKESLQTSDVVQARRLAAAKNQAVEQPQMNKSMAKAYLSAKSPELCVRTWADVMDHYVRSGVESTRDRKARAFRSKPFAMLCKIKLVDTEAVHLFAVFDHKRAGNSTHHYLRRIHNYALHVGWLLTPVMADAAWPALRRQKFTALTEEEHLRIVEREQNRERRLFYEMLWETGGAQSDIANLNWDRIDPTTNTLRFYRQKLASHDEGRGGGASCLAIGSRMRAILNQLPPTGDFFPVIKREQAKHRAAEFKRRCRTLDITGRVLHSYRYAWAQRAKAAGMPEREAMNHLGHKSRAIHAAYGNGVAVITLPLEYYETQKAEKIIHLDQQNKSVGRKREASEPLLSHGTG